MTGRYKGVYVILFFIVLLLGFGFLLLNQRYAWFDDKDVTVITSLVALLIATISLAIADPKLKKFQGRLEICCTGRIIHGDYYLCIIKIFNSSTEPLVNFKVDFRYPAETFARGDTVGGSDYFKLSSVVIVNNDNYRFLGTGVDDNFAAFEHYLALERFKNNAFISIHADGMEVRTFLVSPAIALSLFKNIGTPLYLPN